MNDDVPPPMQPDEEGPPTTAPLLDIPPPPSTAPGSPKTLSPDAVIPALGGLPGYEILEELGRGAMGVVFRARQVVLKRDVALKMILSGSPADDERRRFLAEAEVIASLQHPGVVQIYDFGTHQGSPYFAMELCPGGTLAGKLGGQAMAAREAAELLAILADAVQAAHERGVVHRDLKPGNVLLTADGKPKVADFGLARRSDASVLTQSGAIMGTPAYMAPEQASGKKEVGPAADIWALGAILYECLTGRVPFAGDSSLDIFMRILGEEPERLRKRNAAVPRPLETICLKCLQKDPAQRYASAKELGDDLRRFLAGERILARTPPLGRRAAKWVRRRLWACVALAGIVAALGAGLVLGALKGPGWFSSGRGPAEVETIEVPGRRYALLVGVNDYTATTMPELHHADDDIEALAELLKSPSAGFEQVRVLNTARGSKARKDEPTAANIRKALEELTNGRRREDALLVALCGHGAMLTGVADGQLKTFSFFCPSDADLAAVDFRTGRGERLVNLDHLLDAFKDSGAGVKLLVIDACRTELGPGQAMILEGRAIPRGVAALFSCKGGEMAFESPKLGHGLFFHAVLEGLRGQAKNEDGVVTWDRLAAYVKRQVARDVPRVVGGGARQTPHVLSNLEGDPILSCPGKRVIRPPAKSPDEAEVPEVLAGGKVPGTKAALSGLAAEIKDLTRGDKQVGVSVGEFLGHPERLSGAGAGMQRTLIEELEKLDVPVKKAGQMIVRGEYFLQDGGEDDELILRLILTVRDRKGRKVRELPRNVRFSLAKNNDDIVKLLGLQVDLSGKTKATPEDRNYEIKKQLEKPPLHIEKNQIKTHAKSSYAIEILVKRKGEKGYKPTVPAEDELGVFSFVLKDGDEYQLKLRNDSKSEAAATVAIDGVDAFRFYPPAGERPAAFLLPPGEAREVKGWQIGLDKVSAFVAGALPEQEKKAGKGDLKGGRITVGFHPCWPVGKTPPEYLGSRAPSADPVLHSLGPKPGLVKRTIGPLVNSLSVRYRPDEPPVPLAEPARAALAKVAKQVAGALKDEVKMEVAISEIVGPPEPAIGGGILNGLVDELRKLGVAIRESAFLVLKGEYLVIDDEDNKKELVVRIVLTLRNKKGKTLREFSEDLAFRGEDGSR